MVWLGNQQSSLKQCLERKRHIQIMWSELKWKWNRPPFSSDIRGQRVHSAPTSPGSCPAWASSDFLSKTSYPWKGTGCLLSVSKSSEFHPLLSPTTVDSSCGESPLLEKNKRHFYKAWNYGTKSRKEKEEIPLPALVSKLWLWDSHANLGYSLPSSQHLAWSSCSHRNEK